VFFEKIPGVDRDFEKYQSEEERRAMAMAVASGQVKRENFIVTDGRLQPMMGAIIVRGYIPDMNIAFN